jgi:two-component sensor histidine kinase
VRLALHAIDQSGEGVAQWCLFVSDNGIGLPSDFELRRSQSLGLQLATDLAHQLGGTLRIESAAAPDTGTVFSVCFPLSGLG